MTKRFASVLFVVLAVLASVVPASAQIRYGYIPQSPDGWFYAIQGNQVGMLTADNLGMVRDLSNQLRRSNFRSVLDDLRWNGSAYGLPIGGGFYPMYDRDRRPLTIRQRIERGAGIVAMTDGARRIVNNPRGVGGWIEAAVGVVLTNDSRYRGEQTNQNQRDNGIIVTPPSPGQGVRIASDGTPVAVGTRPGYQDQSELNWQMLRNEFDGVAIYARVQGSDPNQPIVIPAGQTVTLQITRGSQIWAEAQVCVNEGCTVQRWRQDVGRRPLPQGAGWVFYNPEEGR